MKDINDKINKFIEKHKDGEISPKFKKEVGGFSVKVGKYSEDSFEELLNSLIKNNQIWNNEKINSVKNKLISMYNKK